MKVFIACSHADNILINQKILEINTIADKDSIEIFRENSLSPEWKENVKKKIELSDFLLLILGPTDVFENENILWELEQAKKYDTPIYGLELQDFCKSYGYHDFKANHTLLSSTKQLIEILKFENQVIQKNLLESYKILVTSSEKVTEQRSKVHTLFLALLTAIISMTIAFAQKQGMDKYTISLFFFSSIIIILITILWEKLIVSYGKLNTAKFIIINSLEKKLRVNNFDKEWKILENSKYLTTTSLEKKLVSSIRIFSYGLIALSYFLGFIYLWL